MTTWPRSPESMAESAAGLYTLTRSVLERWGHTYILGLVTKPQASKTARASRMTLKIDLWPLHTHVCLQMYTRTQTSKVELSRCVYTRTLVRTQCYGDRVSCCLGWLQAHCVAEDRFKFLIFPLPPKYRHDSWSVPCPAPFQNLYIFLLGRGLGRA